MKIIYLNGASSSGKTSLSRELQEILSENYLHIGIDTLISMMPEKSNNFVSAVEKEGFYWQEMDLPNSGKGMRVISGEYGKKVNSSFHNVVTTLINSGHNLIIDDVANGIAEVKIWERELQNHFLVKVGVYCSLPELKFRESQRTDRMQGSTSEQYFRVHEGVNYDLKVHTDQYTTKECAQQIADHITHMSPNSVKGK